MGYWKWFLTGSINAFMHCAYSVFSPICYGFIGTLVFFILISEFGISVLTDFMLIPIFAGIILFLFTLPYDYYIKFVKE